MFSKRSSSSSRSSSPASIIGGNEDLLIEIFIFLSPKTLIRFKTVSKHWHSLISSPFFCSRHTLRHRPEAQKSSFILGGDEPKLFLLNPITRRLSPFPVPVEFRFVKVLQSCNGLLLLRCRKTVNGRNHYFVANPTTAQQRSLSPLPSTSFSGLYLIFDPSLSPHYKVVCFAHTAKFTRFHIYNSDTLQWKLGGKTTNRILSFRSGIYFNGGICFLRSRSSSSYHFAADDSVTELPDLPRHHGSLGRQKNYTMESNGVLFCLTLSWKEESIQVHVSEMKNFEEGWKKKFRVETRPFLRWFERNRARIGAVGLLCMIRGESEGRDSSLLLRLNRDNIVLYKFGDGVFETVDEYKSEEFQRDNRWWDVKYAHSFIRSLAPV